MFSLRSLKRTFLSTVIFNQNERFIFYRVILTQLENGRNSQQAISALLGTVDISQNITRVASIVAQILYEGGTLSEGLEESLMVPVEEYQLIAVGESRGDLVATLKSIEEVKAKSIGLVNRVIFPNLYWIVILCAISTLYLGVEPLTRSLKHINLEGNAAVSLSIHLNNYIAIYLIAIFLLLSLLSYLRVHAYGKRRGLIGSLKEESENLFRYRFCKYASMMYRSGATNTEVLESGAIVFANYGFMRKAISHAIQLHVVESEDYEDVLAKTILGNRFSKLLKALVPGGQRNSYAEAFRCLESIIFEILGLMYSRLFLVFRLVIVGGIIYLILTLISSLNSFFQF